MTSKEFSAIRASLGFTPLEWGRALGYGGKNRTVQIMMYQMESGVNPVPARTALLAKALAVKPVQPRPALLTRALARFFPARY